MPEIGPAPVLALLTGIFHTALYAFLRGSTGGRLPVLVVAAVLGAYAGQALGARLGDPLRIGDFAFLWASAVAWAGMLLVAVLAVLGPARGRA